MNNLIEDIIENDKKCKKRSIIKRVRMRVLEELALYDKELELKREKLRQLLGKEEQLYEIELEALRHEQEEQKRLLAKANEHVVDERFKPIRVAPSIFNSRKLNEDYNEMRKKQIEEQALMRDMKLKEDQFWHILQMDNFRQREDEFRLKELKRKMEMFQIRCEYEKHIENARKLKKENYEREKRFEREKHAMLAKCLADEKWLEFERKKHQQMEFKKKLLEDIETSKELKKDLKIKEIQFDEKILDECSKDVAKEMRDRVKAKEKLLLEQELFLTGQNIERDILRKDENERNAMLLKYYR